MKARSIIFINTIFIIILLYSCKNTNTAIKYSTLINNQEIILNKLKYYESFNGDGNFHAIIYFIPFNILTRFPLNVEDVKRIYHIKEEIRDNNKIYNFIKNIDNTVYIILDRDYFNIRCVIDIFYNDTIIFSYSSETGEDIIIDNYMIENGEEFINFLFHYLPENYSDGFLLYNNR